MSAEDGDTYTVKGTDNNAAFDKDAKKHEEYVAQEIFRLIGQQPNEKRVVR